MEVSLRNSWRKVVGKHGNEQYENVLTGERQTKIPLGSHRLLTSRQNVGEANLDFPEHTTPQIRRKLTGILQKHRDQVKIIKRYFRNMVHVLCRKFEGGINPAKLNASNFVRDALTAGQNGGGRYSKLHFNTKVTIESLPPNLQKQIQRQEVKLASILQSRKRRVVAGIKAVVLLIREGSPSGTIERECSLLAKHPYDYVKIKNIDGHLLSQNLNGPAFMTLSPERGSPGSNAKSPITPSTDDGDPNYTAGDNFHADGKSALENAYNLELLNSLEERRGLLGELWQELIEVNIHAKLSMRCRISSQALDQSQSSKHKVLMDSIKRVARRRNMLAESAHNGEVTVEDQVSNLQVKLAKLKLDLAKAQQAANDQNETKASIIRQVLHMHAESQRYERKTKSDSHTKLLIDVKAQASKRKHLNLRHHGLERKTGVAKTPSSPSMSTALQKLHKYQHEISDRFKKFQRISLRNKTSAVGTILHQDPNTGECIILMDKNAKLLKHILPNQITIKNDEKFPLYSFGDRVRATNYNITGLKYYLGTIQKRHAKIDHFGITTYEIKFDDGEILPNVLPYYIKMVKYS